MATGTGLGHGSGLSAMTRQAGKHADTGSVEAGLASKCDSRGVGGACSLGRRRKAKEEEGDGGRVMRSGALGRWQRRRQRPRQCVGAYRLPTASDSSSTTSDGDNERLLVWAEGRALGRLRRGHSGRWWWRDGRAEPNG
ncbi:hypothetical protein NL676_031457 [Syzygium grande]|nr:hypothetical protein NL676_031457 [Syzygium grande]